jgi:hypothetical protein
VTETPREWNLWLSPNPLEERRFCYRSWYHRWHCCCYCCCCRYSPFRDERRVVISSGRDVSLRPWRTKEEANNNGSLLRFANFYALAMFPRPSNVNPPMHLAISFMPGATIDKPRSCLLRF